jgi:5-methyltetrahydropteroyltriglutamate--homocysteine methyltransferase
MTVSAANLGFPRIGPRRELKTATEAYWAGKIDQDELLATARELRAATWERQKSAGIDVIPSNDFSFYDQVLDTSVMVGAIPAIYRSIGGANSLDLYFAMARGRQTKGSYDEASDGGCAHGHGADTDVPAQEMTKWFDTNYHYMVPEVSADQAFVLSTRKVLDQYEEARALGYETRPVILGPITFLHLAKSKDVGLDPITLLPKLLPIYAELLVQLKAAGAEWVQIDEPALVLDLPATTREAYRFTYATLAGVGAPKIMLATYFGALGDNLATALGLPVAGLHIDLVRAPEQFDAVLAGAPAELVLSLGVIDGRNIWRADLGSILDRVEGIVGKRIVQIAPSCSLLHTPVDLALETKLDPQVKNWLAFATQKLAELATITAALRDGRYSVSNNLTANALAVGDRANSPLTRDPAVRERLANVDTVMMQRASPFADRIRAQQAHLALPLLPTTTIGSFPQTPEVRKARAAHDKGVLDKAGYQAFLQDETARTVRWQEEIGLDVLVHGEFERNDMVQYFGEQLAGFAFSRAGWVQSYGSRCVRPPIIYGDVSRPEPMTVRWWQYAQSLTGKPMKGMLTGPVTILNWSFVRDDQSRESTCRQIALAIRDEVLDLEAAGCKVIQIDEAALREGLPLRKSDWQNYLDWAVESFRLSAAGVGDATQIHTHMCYSEFNEIITSIGAMDADVVSIETSRSKMELLDAFVTYKYPNEIGPGVYDIHSPRIPSTQEMETLLLKAGEQLEVRQLWVNPDCGLKTRKWEDVKPALVNMVAAAKAARAALVQPA